MSYQTPQEPLEPFFDSPEEPGIMTTAKFGIYSLMALVTGIIITFLGFPFGGLFGIASLVLAIMSLVKKETPKWPAWVNHWSSNCWVCYRSACCHRIVRSWRRSYDELIKLLIIKWCS